MDLLLALMILAHREGHQLVEGQAILPIDGHQLRADRPRPQALAHHIGADPEPGGDVFGRKATPFGLITERFELVCRVGLGGHGSLS